MARGTEPARMMNGLNTTRPECAADVPVLARLFEAAGIAAVLVTNMPFWSERVGAQRSLAVEFPFGHVLGQAHNQELQRRVILQALDVLERPQDRGDRAFPGAVARAAGSGPTPLASRDGPRRSRQRWGVT